MKEKAPRNRTLALAAAEKARLAANLTLLKRPHGVGGVRDTLINQDFYEAAGFLPAECADLVFVDPPYNLDKRFNAKSFKGMALAAYEAWVEGWLREVIRIMKADASLYVCGDWRSAGPLHYILSKYLIVRNRITFEREKGRGSQRNWKNNAEDIWFCTKSGGYNFNAAAVMVKRRVIAPYRENGRPKGWAEEAEGNYRLTYPSNIWTDITIPFWSMAENTPHPTQKPEKLLARIILASSEPGDLVFDPFAGVGTAAVVARKLGRHYCAVEIDKEYCLYAAKRLELAAADKRIQGMEDGVFWERNTLNVKARRKTRRTGKRRSPDSECTANVARG